MKKYEIYVGCKDRIDLHEKISPKYLIRQLDQIFVKAGIGFSMTDHVGGYLHENGTYIIENGVMITVVGNIEKDRVNRFISFLKETNNQECVLLVEKEIKRKYLKQTT